MSEDTIYRQDAIEIIDGYMNQFASHIGTPTDNELYAYARGTLLGVKLNINALPTAESRKGGNYKCYKCGAEIHLFDLLGEWRYCPNCGEATVWVGV